MSMSRTLHAARVGLRRGRTEMILSLKSAQDQSGYLILALMSLGYLFIRRNTVVEGTDLSFPTLAMPSLLGSLIVFTLIMGPAGQLAMDREDGTLLRAKTAPGGMVGYVTSQIALHTGTLLPTLVVILVPGSLLFDNLMPGGARGWLRLAWVLGLSVLATLPIGVVIGALVPSVQKTASWGLLPVMVLAGISGIFYPVQALWGWLQGVAQVFPMYWVGLGMRSAFLPADAAALELGESWRTAQTVGVLGAWAILGVLIAPIILQRMARRQSGSTVQKAREQSAQYVR